MENILMPYTLTITDLLESSTPDSLKAKLEKAIGLRPAVVEMQGRVAQARFTQAGSEVNALLGRLPSNVNYQPTLATDMGTIQERALSR